LQAVNSKKPQATKYSAEKTIANTQITQVNHIPAKLPNQCCWKAHYSPRSSSAHRRKFTTPADPAIQAKSTLASGVDSSAHHRRQASRANKSNSAANRTVAIAPIHKRGATLQYQPAASHIVAIAPIQDQRATPQYQPAANRIGEIVPIHSRGETPQYQSAANRTVAIAYNQERGATSQHQPAANRTVAIAPIHDRRATFQYQLTMRSTPRLLNRHQKQTAHYLAQETHNSPPPKNQQSTKRTAPTRHSQHRSATAQVQPSKTK
jgi:hypothetical protein